MKGLKKYICTANFVAKTETGKRVRIEAGKIYFGSYDFENLAACRGFLFVSVNGITQKLYIQSGDYWINRLKFIAHCNDNVEATPVETIKRKRIVNL
jgi:hypothetical protein